MKKHVLGFGSIAKLVDNSPGNNSSLGELSTWSQTYTKNRGEYTDPGIPGIRLNTFSVKADGEPVEQTLTYTEYSVPIRVIQACMEYARVTPLPIDPTDFRDAVQAEMFSDIESLEFGELVDNGSVTLPSWVKFVDKAEDKNVFTVWLADEAFSIQYPEYQITVIPPLPDLHMLYGNWQLAVNAMAEWTNIKLMEEVQAAKDLHPETYVRYYEFDFVNRTNNTQKKSTPWYILVYGEAGDNDDAIKDAIIDFLVKGTGQDESVWEPIFPELFKRTEFILYPRWDLMSIPNMSTLTGLYSPFLGIKDSTDYAIANTPFYPEPHIKENSFIFPVTYKAVSIVGINGTNNIDEQKDMKAVWKDYIPVSTSSPDFQRMDPKTQNWVHFMIKLVETAETATWSSALPQGIRRVRRGDLWYVASNHNKGNYVVAMRDNFV